MCQGAGVEVHTRSEPGPQTRVAILSVCLIRRIQQIANYMFAICWIRAGHPVRRIRAGQQGQDEFLRVGIPGAGSHVWHDNLTDVLRLGAAALRMW